MTLEARLNKIILAVTVGDINIHEFTLKSVKDAMDFIKNLKLNEREEISKIIKRIAPGIPNIPTTNDVTIFNPM